ncbi:hypothetical protein KKB43_02600 [Patescibacteria group bacterium]|nr:hypothetical protein [Patescibacteria group bacterium]MBU4579882.1 hypothetical protein [Patescibacteria group bacterium]
MTDKDKSFFAKLILASVVLVAFLTVLGLTAELVKNKRVVNPQPQVSPVAEPAKISQVPDITILSPNGDESWMLGSTQTIKWSSAGNISEVTILLVPVDSDAGVRTLDKVANAGSYSWNIPYCYPGHECSSNFEIPAGKYKIQISSFKLEINDESDLPFSIIYPDEISDWKTYRNEEYGFEVKYPEIFTVATTKSYYGYERGFPEIKFDALVEFHQARYSNIDFMIDIDASEKSMQELEKIYDRSSSSLSYFLNSKKEILINNHKSIEYRWGMLEGGIGEITILLSHNSKTIIVSTPDLSDTAEMFNQILSSFKFTEK